MNQEEVYKILFEICSKHCQNPDLDDMFSKIQISNLNEPMKTKGLIDSFSNMTLLTELAKKLNRLINWDYNFNLLNTPQSFLDALM